MELLLPLLTNKLFLGIAGGALAVLIIYIKGYSQGKATSEARQAEIAKELQERVHEIEAKNQNINREREKKNAEINGASDATVVSELLNSLFKDKGDKAD